MSKMTIGIDPDSKAHGVAFYNDSELICLKNYTLIDLLMFLDLNEKNKTYDEVVVHMEDVTSVSAAFKARDSGQNIHVKLKMAQYTGMCKQSQIELERLFEYYEVKVIKHKISKSWKKDKAQFEKVTGWKGRSNEDTRSAAYFGYLGLNKSSRNC